MFFVCFSFRTKNFVQLQKSPKKVKNSLKIFLFHVSTWISSIYGLRMCFQFFRTANLTQNVLNMSSMLILNNTNLFSTDPRHDMVCQPSNINAARAGGIQSTIASMSFIFVKFRKKCFKTHVIMEKPQV